MFKPEKTELTDCIIPERPPTLHDNGMALLIHKTVTQKKKKNKQRRKEKKRSKKYLGK